MVEKRLLMLLLLVKLQQRQLPQAAPRLLLQLLEVLPLVGKPSTKLKLRLLLLLLSLLLLLLLVSPLQQLLLSLL